MGYKLAHEVWKLRSVRGLVNKAVLAVCADFATEKSEGYGGNIRPSMGTLAEQTDICERSVQKAVRTLEREGWLIPTRKAAQHRPAVYRLNVEKLTAEIATLSRGARGAPYPGSFRTG